MSTSDRAKNDFLPTAALATLRRRARLSASARRFFDERGYWEVQTQVLSHDVTVDAWLEPFETVWQSDAMLQHANADSAPVDRLFLQTSPEFAMKRLLAAGADAIYQIGPVMRNGERGHLHNPEFTMIEWYRVGDTHHEQMDCVEELVKTIYGEAAALLASDQPSSLEIRAMNERANRSFERFSYDEAFERYAGTTVLARPIEDLRELAQRHGITPPPGLAADDRDGWLNLLLAELVEPRLGQDVPTFVFDYPASQAALAKVRNADPAVAERFELYDRGIELCNGYHELTDADELRRRMGEQAALRAAEGRRALPRENRLLAAMEAGLPASAGVALGFDRLVMLALGCQSVAEVIAFPFDRA